MIIPHAISGRTVHLSPTVHSDVTAIFAIPDPVLPRLTLQWAIVGAVAAAVLAGLVPSAVVLDRRLAATLETRARSDLALAPRVFMDRELMSADAMKMHAKDFAQVSGLAEALARGDRAAARRVAAGAHDPADGIPLIVGPDGEPWAGPSGNEAIAALARRTRSGELPVATIANGAWVQHLSLAGVNRNGRWVGAAGFSLNFDTQQASVLAGLTRADIVLIVAAPNGAAPVVGATTMDTATANAVLNAARQWPNALSQHAGLTQQAAPVNIVHDIIVGRHRFIASAAPIFGAGAAVFVRNLDGELAVLPMLRRLALVSSLAALLVALVVGAALAALLAHPVHELAGAADALAEGEFNAPLPHSAVREVARMASAFGAMRTTLAARLAQLRESNALLADRNAQLTTLQADLVQRERLAATGRLVAQLAHEIRNPVASLRNCLELIRRRVVDDPEAREFTDLAIDELLRMHELAEQMLDVHRPRAAEAALCCPAVVACDVAALLMAGVPATTPAVTCEIDGSEAVSAEATIAPGALKQVLHNLVQNAREAMQDQDTDAERVREIVIRIGTADDSVIITVADNGPGIPSAVLPRMFDPFFTTKADMHGVGLGLFVADGIVRGAGGRLTAGNRTTGDGDNTQGAVFRVELPMVNRLSGSSDIGGAAA
ncbi:MAG: sensor histidine kinase [Gemmatimonadaceae bacterium]